MSVDRVIGVAVSRNGVRIRLTEERWFHIVENHDELAGLSDEVLLTVEDPDYIVRGWTDELLAVRRIDKKYLVVVYKELGNDGFIITAFITKRIGKVLRRGIVWRKM
ncbi:hypothetical protein D1872_311660 [compost metagenome]